MKRARKKGPRGKPAAAIAGADSGGTGPVCPYCRHEITWENLGSSETEISIYVREKLYYCPGCRAVLGIASWHTEG